MKYVSINKPKLCPKCGSKKVVRILYGYPSYEAFLEEEAGKLILGGCIIRDNAPEWGCLNCKIKIYRKKSKQ